MTSVRDKYFSDACQIIQRAGTPTLRFSELRPRRRNAVFNVVNDTVDVLLDKAVGSEKTEQASFLIYQLKRVLPQTRYLQSIANEFKIARRYDETSQSQRKSYGRHLYPIFDTFLEKISGSSEIENQRKFLQSRFQHIHSGKRSYEPLCVQASWSTVHSMLNSLDLGSGRTPFTEHTARQIRNRKPKMRALQKFVVVVAGSEEQIQQEAMFNQLMKMNHQKASLWNRLELIVQGLPFLEPFASEEIQNKRNRKKYSVLNCLVQKLSGCENQRTRSSLELKSNFLRNRFPKCFQLNWACILDPENWDHLSENVNSPQLIRNMKKLLRRFTSGDYSRVLPVDQQAKLNLQHPVFKRLRNLCNELDRDIRSETITTNRDVIHNYANILACLASNPKDSGPHISYEEFVQAGWEFGRYRYRTARKRQLDGRYTEVRPLKRGRTSISEELIKKIENEWVRNSRPAANRDISNPKNRDEKKIMLRILKPALHIMLECDFVRTALHPDGIISTTTFQKYRPW